MANLSSLNFRLTANIAPFRKGLNKAERSMDRLGRKMQQTGKNMSMKLTAPIAALGAMSFNVFRDFELEMAKVKAVSGATRKLLDNLEDAQRNKHTLWRFSMLDFPLPARKNFDQLQGDQGRHLPAVATR